MGKRTSDFMALTTILVGAGFGLGVMSLAARSGPVRMADDLSMIVHVERHIVIGEVAEKVEVEHLRRVDWSVRVVDRELLLSLQALKGQGFYPVFTDG